MKDIALAGLLIIYRVRARMAEAFAENFIERGGPFCFRRPARYVANCSLIPSTYFESCPLCCAKPYLQSPEPPI